MNISAEIMIPFTGTVAGTVYASFLKNALKSGVREALLGFASGVAVAVSVWLLPIPSMNMSECFDRVAFVPASADFLLDIGFLFLPNEVIPHLHTDTDGPEGSKGNWKRSTMLVLTATLHNVPEDMAVDVASVGLLSENSSITMAGVPALSADITIQSFPEGVIVSFPLKEAVGKKRAFVYGMLSGIVEPIGAFLMLALFEALGPALPYFLSSTIGAMIYVVMGELTPESVQGEHSSAATIGLAAGFMVTTILDMALGQELRHQARPLRSSDMKRESCIRAIEGAAFLFIVQTIKSLTPGGSRKTMDIRWSYSRLP